MDAGVGDPAGGVRGVQAERGRGDGELAGSAERPPEEAVAALREALEDPEPLVREHAAWALGRKSCGDDNSAEK